MLYEKFEKAWEDADVDLYKSLHHDDWEFKFHSSGHVILPLKQITTNDLYCFPAYPEGLR